MKIFVLIMLSMLLTACNTTPKVLTKDVYITYNIPKTLYNCPQIRAKDFPHPDTATNQEISGFLVKLYTYNKTCGINMNAIKRYIEAAEKRIQKG